MAITERLLDINDPETQHAPARVQSYARRRGKQILRIVWDEDGGYPEKSWGYEQWSTRPYEQRQGCDGTVDMNVHLIGLRFCEELGLNYQMLYQKAYEQDDPLVETEWIETVDWEAIEAQTIVPELSEKTLKNLLYDLAEINNHSFVDVLQEEFTNLGFNVENWWEDED